MFAKFSLILNLLNLALLIRVQCNNLYANPKTVYVIAGNKLTVNCNDNFSDEVTTISKKIEWVKLNSSLIISNQPGARVRRDGHRLLFDSTNYSDGGLYCCRFQAEDHGCTSSSTIRILVVTRRIPALATKTMGHSVVEHNLVAKSTSSGTATWRLEANPRQRCVLLGRSASVNCLNNSISFAHDIQWFKILPNGGLERISRSLQERITSNAYQLQFKSTIAEDEGLYCCKPQTAETECSSTAITNITISLPPVLSPLQNHTVQIGETIAMNCTVTYGEPTKFYWQKYGKDIPKNNPRYSIIISNNTTTLTITNATIMDQGYYSCIVRNRKYQQDNESLYLHVQLPLGCSMINTSYSITVGLTSAKNCSSIERASLYSVINKFLQSICNCSDYCMTLEISCSPNDAIGTIVVTLKEKQPLHLNRLVYSALKGRQVTIIVDNQNYSILCVVKTLCEEPTTPTATIYISNNSSSKEDTDENNNIMISPAGIAITVVIIVMLLVLIVLVVVAIMLRVSNKKQKSKPATKSEHSLQTDTHTTPSVQPASRAEAVINGHPSTSSNDTGFISLSDTGSPVSDSMEDTFLPNMSQSGQSIENSNTNLSNENATTNSSIPADRSTLNPLNTKQSKRKVVIRNQRDSASKHHRSIPSTDESASIHWKDNETYCRLDPHKSVNECTSSASIPNPSVIGQAKLHFYDDVEGINESRRRAAITANTSHSHRHHNKKHTKPRLPGNCSELNSKPTHSYQNVSPVCNVTVNGSKGKLLHIANYKHSSLSQV